MNGSKRVINPIFIASRLKRILNTNLNKPGTPHPLRIMAGFDMNSLRDVLTTLNWMDFRGTFPQGKVYSSKKVIRDEEERLRLRKEKKLEQEKRVKLRIKEENRGRKESSKSIRLRKA